MAHGATGWGRGAAARLTDRSLPGQIMARKLVPMLTRLASMAFALFALFGALPAAAQECGITTPSRMLSFAEATGPAVPATNCAVMEGILVGQLFVEDNLARYRLQQRLNDPSSSGAILGYYGEQRVTQPMRARLTGRIAPCTTSDGSVTARTPPEQLVGQFGYCAGFAGRAFQATRVELLGPANFVRVLPDAQRPELGNLAPLAAGETRTRMLRSAQRFLIAMQARDMAALAALHGGGPDGRRSPAEIASILAHLLAAADSPFAPLRGADPASVQVALFGWKRPLWADSNWDREAIRAGEDAIACFSTRADAARLWPIDSKDADNLAGRPYACTRMHIDGTGIDAQATFDTEQARAGFAEPAG